MSKPYIFNKEQYYNLNTLGQAYIDNFALGMEDIYSNTKNLIKFVKRNIKDKKKIQNIIDILVLSKYKNNALTFLIFDFCDDKKVVINGKSYTFMEFVNALKNYEPSKTNALYAFMEDFGITKTFATLDPNSPILKDSYYLDRNCYDNFTRKYLTTYHDFTMVESLNSKISSIAINGEECFRRGTKIASSEEFQLGLAHKKGFKLAIRMHQEINPLFQAIKLLKEESEIEDLRKLIADGFYWWLMDNLDKYDYKPEAKATYNRIMKIKKEYNKYMTMVSKKKIQSIALDLYSDLARGLYLNYLNFAYLFKNGKITVKRKYDPKQYSLDKPYCRTYICADYMAGKVIKLYNEKTNEENTNPLVDSSIDPSFTNNEESVEETSAEVVDDTQDEAPVNEEIFEVEQVKDKLEKHNKLLGALRRFSSFAIFLSVFNAIVIAVAVVLAFMFSDSTGFIGTISKNCKDLFTTPLIIYSAGVFIVALASSITLQVRVAQSMEYLSQYLFIENAKDNAELSQKQENRLFTLMNKKDLIEKKSMRRHIVASTFTLVSAAMIISVVVMAILICSCKYVSFIDSRSYFDSSIKFLFYAVSPAVACVFGLIFKKKGVLTMLLVMAITLIAAVIMMLIL